MITFKQFLNEDETLEDLGSFVKEHCAQFLSKSNHAGLLFRGIKDHPVTGKFKCSLPNENGPVALRTHYLNYSIIKVRKNRLPKDTSLDVHYALDNWFEREHDIRARSETIFCVPETAKNRTKNYGKTAIVFPMGSFKFIWSPEVRDLFDEVGSGRALKTEDGTEFDLDKVDAFMNKFDYRTTGLDSAIKQRNIEIMIDCDQYLAITAPAAALDLDEIEFVKEQLNINTK